MSQSEQRWLEKHPRVKVAVLDKSFFSRSTHPARRLLNEIAAAAMGWGDCDGEARDSLYLRIEQVVQRLLSDFVDDPAIFSELLADFLAFTSDERRRSELLEQRLRDAEEGRAKSEMARQQVELALNQRLLGKTLPEAVVRLLQEAWSKVLMLTCLKHGVESAQWQTVLVTMDELVWSVEPHDDPQARLRLLELVPGLLRSLREGLDSAGIDPFVTSEFFTRLEVLHVQAFQRFKRALPVEVEDEAPAADGPNEQPPLAEQDMPLLELPPEPPTPSMPWISPAARRLRSVFSCASSRLISGQRASSRKTVCAALPSGLTDTRRSPPSVRYLCNGSLTCCVVFIQRPLTSTR